MGGAVEKAGQVAVPKWSVTVVGSVFMTVLLASGGWVVRTWDAPERIATLEAEVGDLKETRAAEKLEAQRKLGSIQTDIALMKKDVASIDKNIEFLKTRNGG